MDKLTTNDQVKLQNILNYYTEYRKTHYDDNTGITIENQLREEGQKNINRELQKLKDVKQTEKYVLLINEKYKTHKEIEIYEDRIYEHKEDTIELNKIYETLDELYDSIETIENKQLEMIKTGGVNTDLLGDNNINALTRLV